MITIKDFMEVVDYRITEGSEFCWQCFGSDAYHMSSWNGKYEDGGYSIGMVFDTKTHIVYECEAHDYTNQRSYRWTNPDYVAARKEEAKTRNVDLNQAYDEIKFQDLDEEEDMLKKATAIVRGEQYDIRIMLSVEFSDEDLLKYMKLAHEKDITFNQLVEEAIRDLALSKGVVI